MATLTDPTEKQQALESGTYDVPDLAALMKCSERHIRRMIDAREIPGLIRFGRLVRFHKGIVNDWLAGKVRS
ncbi:MAG TPA: helix-turn-helix domain-containing protein [Gemmata sp.]